jgi:RNA polymerase sigma-70 factor, ECF subfamily
MLGSAGAMAIKSVDITAEVAGTQVLAGGLTREQFSRRVGPHLPQMLRYCMALAGARDTAEDLLQNALVRAYTHRDSYRGEGSMAGWLCTIARNEHLEHVRTAARRRGLVRSAIERFGDMFEDWFAGTPGSSAPDRDVEIHEDNDALLRALHALPESFRSVVWLCDVEDLSYAEVSATLALPIGTVKSRHARGRARLREVLERVAREADAGLGQAPLSADEAAGDTP